MKTLHKFAILGAVMALSLIIGLTFFPSDVAAALLGLGAAPIAVGLLGMNIRDAQYKATLALPAAPGTVTQAAGFDMETTASADLIAPFEGLISAPAVTVGMLPNGITNTYNVIASANSNLSSPTIIQQSALVQTGAGGAGAVANTARVRIPVNLGALGFRYVGLQVVEAATGGNESTVSATFELLF
jgi:hypothetical protein